MTLAAKGALSFVSSALVSGTFTSAVRPAGPKTIFKLIRETRPDRRMLFDGYNKVFDGSSDHWKFVWKKYRNDFPAGVSNPFSLTQLTGDNAPKEFRDTCRKLFFNESASSTDDEKYNWAVEYCTRSTLVSDWIWESGHEIVPKDNNTDEWKKLWAKYKDSNVWNISDSSSNGEAPEGFKKKCEEEANKTSGNKRDVSVNRVFKYCSKKRVN
ncbi:hypothetical protein MHC_01180 [Mycoplasma haemocanis str. Illinois]|uniref:Uncharacterized protein n=1 Tax=Mycoplasma haemocanis (strain Illinois) TaxID=1111676 RepID=H6N630_MYCHN|nr:hypothetical protein [Mycoplasma haemocanis]AEW45102.1 hypothetical protein MHC_01180 [Mycoplasma haemocanis str. Illinois]